MIYKDKLQTVENLYCYQKIGLRGVAPSSRLSASLCRCIVQRLGVADYKHPCLSRDASPRILPPGTDAGRVCPNALCKDAYKWSNKVGAGRTDNKRPRLHRCRANKAYTALHHGEGVWGFGKDAEIERPKALQDAKPTKCSYRDREFALFFIKADFFSKM